VGDPQQHFAVGVRVHNAAMAHQPGAFTLQRRHRDGKRWVVLQRFASKREAKQALARIIQDGNDRSSFRVKRVRRRG
jgi:hypothetical protein